METQQLKIKRLNIKQIFIFLIFSFSFVYGFDSIEVLNHDITINKSGYFKIDQNLTPQEAYQNFQNEKFLPFPKKAKAFGFSSAEYWFAFDIAITKNNPHFFININDPLAQSCTMYVFQNAQLISSNESGYMVPLKNRSVKQFPIRFVLTDNTIQTTYLIKTVSQYPIYGSYSFGEQHELDNANNINYIIFILSCGIFLTMFFYNIFLYFVVKDKAYIFYCLYIFGYFMITLLAQGYIGLIFSELIAYTPLLLASFLQIKFIGLVFFSFYFLNLKQKYPLLAKTILYLLYANIIASLTVPFATQVQIFSIIFMNMLYLTLLYGGFRGYFSGFKPALYYLIATGIALISSIAYSFMNQGVLIPFNIYSYNLMTFGLIWDVLILSLALAYRIKLLQEENIKNERLALIKSKQTSLGELSGNIAHQWRQPLAEIGSINANIEAKLKYSTTSKEELLEQLNLEKNILRHLSNTVTTFQSFFQNATSNMLFSINDEIKRCISFVQQSMEANDIQVEFIENTNISLYGNENEFSQVILSVILNAKDVLIQREIPNKMIKIELKKYLNGCKIEINDNAGGIKIKPIETIFDSYITDKETGSGIGLFIARTIVEQKFSGKISAYNGKSGAVFEIILQ